jgi:hypothetical protein
MQTEAVVGRNDENVDFAVFDVFLSCDAHIVTILYQLVIQLLNEHAGSEQMKLSVHIVNTLEFFGSQFFVYAGDARVFC